MTYQKYQMIYQLEIRTSNADSVFLYYILEAWDHLCFYSTLSFQKNQQYRDIRIQCTIEMKPLLKKIILDIGKELSFELLSERELRDCDEKDS